MPRNDVSHFLRSCQAYCRNFEIHFRNVWQSQSRWLSRNSVSAAVWEDGGWGDPSDRAAALTEFRYCPLPRACNTWSENTYKIYAKPL